MPSTPTIGKEAFLREHAYLVKADLDVPVSRKKEICFPNTVPVTHGSMDSPVVGALYLRLVSLLVETLVLDPYLGGLLGI
jgi:hypothetical protein